MSKSTDQQTEGDLPSENKEEDSTSQQQTPFIPLQPNEPLHEEQENDGKIETNDDDTIKKTLDFDDVDGMSKEIIMKNVHKSIILSCCTQIIL